MIKSNKDTAPRILSIDALRGFDMLMIIFADQFFYALDEGMQSPFSDALAQQFDHPVWFGSTFYDIIMPLFLFIVGAVIPYSLSSYMKDDSGRGKLYLKLLRRFVILFILGWVVQGNLLDLDINTFRVFSNTLQAIAVGYLIASLAYLHLSRKGQAILFLLCLILYAVLLTVPNVPGLGRSVLLPDQNLAIYVDRLVFGKFDDCTQYTWLLSGLGFTATTLSGMFAGELIKSTLPREKVALYLFLAGVASLAIGLIWGIWHPIIKKLWTSSFVMASSGVCLILLALFYWIIDVKNYQKWVFPLKVIGMNAITAYVISHVIKFPNISNNVLYGLAQFAGPYINMINIIGGFGILYVLLWYMYKNKTFIKV